MSWLRNKKLIFDRAALLSGDLIQIPHCRTLCINFLSTVRKKSAGASLNLVADSQLETILHFLKMPLPSRDVLMFMICLLVPPADNICKQFGPRSDPTKRRFAVASILGVLYWS